MDILEVVQKIQRLGKWGEAEPVRNQLIKEARRSGMTRPDAQKWAYAKLEEQYLASDQETTNEASDQQTEPQSEAGGVANPLGATAEATGESLRAHSRDEAAVTGLDAIPEHWPALAPNAPLGVEIQWVQANRLSVVRDLGDRAVVDLGKAMSPAPSWAALGWLETSIRAYAKFVDVAAKASATLEDEREMVRREKLAIEEVRGLLSEMLSE
jgi:hypothetical protein